MSTSPIKVCERITDSDLSAAPGVMHVVDSLEITGSGPDKSVYAGIWTPEGILSVLYHFGRKSWAYTHEHFVQQAKDYEFGLLHETISKLERKTGIELPNTPVVEFMVGKYGARDRYTTDNPWGIQAGAVYQVNSTPKHPVRYFVAQERNGRTLLTWCDEDGVVEDHFEIEPEMALSMADWKTMKIIKAAPAASKPKL